MFTHIYIQKYLNITLLFIIIMPDIKKNIKFEKQQKEIIDKLFSIIDNTRTFILYNLDNDEKKQKEIIELGEDIKKYYSCSSCRGINIPDCKRPYLSIIRFLLKKNGYDFYSKDYSINQGEGEKLIRTKKYKIL
jgi:hypothetical protein